MMNNTVNLLLDEKQENVYKRFPTDHFLSNPKHVENFLLWNTYFKRNLHRVATYYLGLKLYPYQEIMLYEMGKSKTVTVIASRSAAKSYIIAIYACCMCIVNKDYKFLIASATKGQADLIITEKIEQELMPKSAMLRKEIKDISRTKTGDKIVHFQSGSYIKVVPASDNARGSRSNTFVREEFRMIDKTIEDKVLSPCQVTKQAPYVSDPFYANNSSIIEEATDVYISSSWPDASHWMWKIVDNTIKDMIDGKNACFLAFDESITLKHNIKSKQQLIKEKRKVDPLTWRVEFLNERIDENSDSYFPYSILYNNQRAMKPFYPQDNISFRNGDKNQYTIPKQAGEIRVVGCDFAFVAGKENDNSAFTCMRLIKESSTYSDDQNEEKLVSSGYRRIIPYMEAFQGKTTHEQAIRVRQLYNDFDADYIVLDYMNNGLSIYQELARVLYDEERGVEYPPLSCMNNDKVAGVIKNQGANPCIFIVQANQALNSKIAIDFRKTLIDKKIDLLVPFQKALTDIFPLFKAYRNAPDAEAQLFFESPFLETQALISETSELLYEIKEQTGAIVIREKGKNRKDRYSSCSYCSYFASQLEKDLLSNSDEYEYHTFIN